MRDSLELVTRKPDLGLVEEMKMTLRPDITFGGKITEVYWENDTLAICYATEGGEGITTLSAWDYPREVLENIGGILSKDPDSLDLEESATLLASIAEANEEEAL